MRFFTNVHNFGIFSKIFQSSKILKKVKFVLDIFEQRTRARTVFWAHSKDSNVELKSPTNMTLSERLLMVWKSEELGFPFGQ